MTREIKSVLAAVVILVLCIWCVLAFAQGWPPASTYMSRDQLEATANLWRGEEEEKITCGDLKQLYEEHCKDQKPETEVESPFPKE